MSAPYAPPHVQRVLDQFDKVLPSGDGWSARCPAHKDRKNSLSFGIGERGLILVKCHAGCDTGMVLYHKGLTFADLRPPRDEATAQNGHGQRQAEPPPTDEAPNDSAGDAADEEPSPQARVIQRTRYELRDPSGRLVAYHQRVDRDDGTKGMWFEDTAGNKTLNGVPKADLPLYGIQALGDTKVVIVCEGEKAADALRALGVAAVGTVTGADGCPCDDSLRPLLGLQVGLWPDADADAKDVGRKHMDRIGAALRRLGQPANKLYRIDWPDAPEKGDAFDYVGCGGTRESLRELLKSAPLWQAAPDTAASSTGSTRTGSSGAAAGQSPGGLSLGKDPSQATLLVSLARKGGAELFHDPAGTTYITFALNGHRETWPLTSRNVREWLSRRYYEAYETSPGGDSLKNALTTLGGIATFDGPCREVFVRLGGHQGDIYLDLGNPAWEVARVRASGWDVIPGSEAPVRFRRPRGLLPLPQPAPGGDLKLLRTLINVADDDGFDLVVGSLVGALNPRGTYPILVYSGEQGSAKTTAARFTRACLDPNVAPLRSQPREEGDVLIAATNGLIVGYDNLSKLPDWLSDALCRLTSGGGVGKRQLFSDGDEFILDARRPVLLTGIESVLSRGDAIDRALLVELRTMTKGQRRTDEEVWSAFEAAHPGILGVLLDAASAALRNLPSTHIDDLPRLADFARWVEAAAPALGWEAGHFLAIYNNNRANADEIAVDASPIGPTLKAFLEALGDDGTWEGTASELLAALNERAPEATKKEQEWPKRANSLSGHVKRLAPHLRRLGFGVRIGERAGREGRRVIRLAKIAARHRQQRQHRQQDASETENPRGYADSSDTGADDPPEWGSSADRQHRQQIVSSDRVSADEKPHNDADFSDGGRIADDADAADDDFHHSWEEDPESNAPADCVRPWECAAHGGCPGYGDNGCPLVARAQEEERETWTAAPLIEGVAS